VEISHSRANTHFDGRRSRRQQEVPELYWKMNENRARAVTL
jgi:hypothetical protein